jgi:hypothetical protein
MLLELTGVSSAIKAAPVARSGPYPLSTAWLCCHAGARQAGRDQLWLLSDMRDKLPGQDRPRAAT